MEKPKRKLNRLREYNYDLEGYYFITICTQGKREYFGEVINQEMILNKYGEIAQKFWREIPKHYKNIAIDKFVIMPNHIHGIIIITKSVGTEQCSVPTAGNKKNYGLLSKVVKSFKDVTIKQIHQQFNDYQFQWQRSFYDHIICDDEGLYNIREYIMNNPLMWERDRNKDV